MAFPDPAFTEEHGAIFISCMYIHMYVYAGEQSIIPIRTEIKPTQTHTQAAHIITANKNSKKVQKPAENKKNSELLLFGNCAVGEKRDRAPAQTGLHTKFKQTYRQIGWAF